MDIAAARECVGDLAGLSLEDALFAATAGEVAAADRALELALAEGAAAVQVVRAGLGHVQRLQRARAAMAERHLGRGGDQGGTAAGVLSPRSRRFSLALTLWRTAGAGVGGAAILGTRSVPASAPARPTRRSPATPWPAWRKGRL